MKRAVAPGGDTGIMKVAIYTRVKGSGSGTNTDIQSLPLLVASASRGASEMPNMST